MQIKIFFQLLNSIEIWGYNCTSWKVMFNLNFAKISMLKKVSAMNNYATKIHTSKTLKIWKIIPRERFGNFVFKWETLIGHIEERVKHAPSIICTYWFFVLQILHSLTWYLKKIFTILSRFYFFYEVNYYYRTVYWHFLEIPLTWQNNVCRVSLF